MGCVVEVLAVLALVSTGIAIMAGVLSPGDALRRLGVVLLLLLIVPVLITALVQGVTAPMLAGLRTVTQEIAVVLAIIAAVVLIGWLILHYIQPPGRNKTTREE